MLWRCLFCKRKPVVGNRARLGAGVGGSAGSVGGGIFGCLRFRRWILLVLLIFSLPPLELIRRYHEEIWNYCPYINFDWAVDSVLKAKCEMPHMNLWDPTVVQYLKAERPVKECAKDYPLVRMKWSPTRPDLPSTLELTERGQRELSHFKCFHQLLTRNTDDKSLFYSSETEIKQFPIDMPGEIVQIVCREKTSGDVFYTDSFGSIITLKPANLGDGRTFDASGIKKKWNIMVVGIDSVSRQSFIRFLPKSFEWLNSKSNEGVHVFNAYHKIGENTFPNLVPMLTGRKVELSSPTETLQLPHSGSLFHSWMLRMPFDSYPLVWKEFASAGYVTGYVEDDPQIATFNLMKRGFKEQPTDHYGRSLFLAFDAYKNRENKVNPSLTLVNETTGEWETIEPNYFCINGRLKFEVLWDYSIRQFITRYNSIAPSFMFSWLVGLTHEWLTTLKLADFPLLDTLKFLLGDTKSTDSAPWRDNTFVFLLSDHGQRVDKIRSTFVGRLEDRLPFLAISIPPAFRKKYPKMSSNLAKNTEHLVTALDLYATFKHILYLGTVDESKATDSPGDFTDVGPSGYANSLFSEINPMRSCADAGIPEWYCACHRYTELNETSNEAKAAARAMAKSIEHELVEGTSTGYCANLSISSIESIRRVEFTLSARRYTSKCRFFGIIKESSDVEDVFDEYVVQVTMKPGGGKFEATVRNHWRTHEGWKLIGGVERVNRYGNQSACLPDSLERLRKICYCPRS